MFINRKIVRNIAEIRRGKIIKNLHHDIDHMDLKVSCVLTAGDCGDCS